jgi:hypothetical protein
MHVRRDNWKGMPDMFDADLDVTGVSRGMFEASITSSKAGLSPEKSPAKKGSTSRK